MKTQPKIGTAQKQKNIKNRRMNKHLLELEAENAKLRNALKVAQEDMISYSVSDWRFNNIDRINEGLAKIEYSL